MRIYLIEQKEKLGNAVRVLEKYGEIIPLTSGEKNIFKYKELFDDASEKIIGVAPGLIDYTFPPAAVKKIKNLKAIITKSSYAHYVDVEYCKKNGIELRNCPGANAQAVAEYAIWQMLSLAKKLPLQLKENYKVTWDGQHLQEEIMGKVMGVIGLGNIGVKVANLGRGLGMKVVYWNRSKKQSQFKNVSLNTLLLTSDFIFNCVGTSKETQGFLNKKNLSLIRPLAYFISVMGGGGWEVEDTDYLIKMVGNGKLAGYSVENEHAEGYKLPKKIAGNVFIPGAYAWYTKETLRRYEKMWVDTIIAVVKGKKFNVVS